MRLDKFLKVSRIIKRRTIAKEVCDKGRIEINGRPGKAGSDVKVGDRLTIGFGRKTLEVEILVVAENMRASEAVSMYQIIREIIEKGSDETADW
jgi:ribosomal 50S subunit-recycling heat shock protein